MPQALRFPSESAVSGSEETTTVVLEVGDGTPVVAWLGPVAAGSRLDPGEVSATASPAGRVPLLAEHARGYFLTPGLRGHRLGGPSGSVAGEGWSTSMSSTDVGVEDRRLVLDAQDAAAGLRLRTEAETLPGGALRLRHRLTNVAESTYLLEGLDVTVPLPDSHEELLDFTGRHERERVPQRRPLADGQWLRTSRRGRPGLESPTLLAAGTPGFGFTHGDVVAVHVGWSGNTAMRVERDGGRGAVLAGGELLLAGEMALGRDDSYTTPWVYVVASSAGLDGVAAALHAWQRSLAAHPDPQRVTLNVWEAVYFDHDADRLNRLADLAGRVGVERFVLDDGWFHGRRDDTAGLGDWWVDAEVWPNGLHPLVEHVHALGMEFGLWFEPEMVNPDSDLFRAHPEWTLSAGGRSPLLQRNQLVLDLTNADAFAHVLASMDAVLSENAVDFVKWDHNRDLLEAGSTSRGGIPAVHGQTTAYYALLDELRTRHPGITWESCASGGGRVDLGVVEHVQRFWTSDMTDALSRQQIQRWTTQLVAPEYLGAHVSAPTSHQTGRTLTLAFRAATALFCGFGIEWDLTSAGEEDLDELARWVQLHKRHRRLLHTGRVVRPESSDPAVLLHGVVSRDRRSALLAHVQVDESEHNRGVAVRVPGLRADERYEARWEGAVDLAAVSAGSPMDPEGPTGGIPLSGALLATVGMWLPRRRPETVTLVSLTAPDS